MKNVTNAVSFWDSQWKSDDGRQEWETPDPRIANMMSFYKERGITDVLDLGAGVGRHALLFAREGCNVHALDGSTGGMEHLEHIAHEQNLPIICKMGDFCSLPYDESTFDLVISWNVIYHGTMENIRQAVKEITRVLRPSGLFQGTIISKQNHNFKVGREIAPNTWIAEGKSDKAHPHSYLDRIEMNQLFTNWKFHTIEDIELGNYPGAYHWHFVAEKM